MKRLIAAMANHDNNEERRYLVSRGRWHLTWGCVWLSPQLCVGVAHDNWPGGEPFAAWISVGPLTLEVYREGARSS